MKDILSLILDDLRALKRDGVESVSVDDRTLSALKTTLETLSHGVETASVPEQKESAGTPVLRERPTSQSKELERRVPVLPPVKNMEELQAAVKADALFCKHAQAGKAWVLGRGNVPAKIFFCGDMPSVADERNKEVFSDESGKLLDKIVAAMGLAAEDVYYSNLHKWRTEMSQFLRRPGLEQTTGIYCEPFLKAELSIVQPRLIVSLGLSPARFFSGNREAKLSDFRGKMFEYCGVKVLAAFHPSYLIRDTNKQTRRVFWEDMLCAMKYLGMEISEKQQAYFLPKN
ncbi:MAG: uracil-DNA glycosylase [Opitutales bacterium]|nr:uracil-DNA glycosylase [Opitutales bacterium]